MALELGELRTLADDRNQLVFTRTLAHPIEKVWRAITEAEHLAHWFPDEMRGERVVGARLVFVPGGDEEAAFEGEVLAFEPPALIESHEHPCGAGTTREPGFSPFRRACIVGRWTGSGRMGVDDNDQ